MYIIIDMCKWCIWIFWNCTYNLAYYVKSMHIFALDRNCKINNVNVSLKSSMTFPWKQRDVYKRQCCHWPSPFRNGIPLQVQEGVLLSTCLSTICMGCCDLIERDLFTPRIYSIPAFVSCLSNIASLYIRDCLLYTSTHRSLTLCLL